MHPMSIRLFSLHIAAFTLTVCAAVAQLAISLLCHHRWLRWAGVLAVAFGLAAGSTASAQGAGEWTWIGGSSTTNQPGVYGILGTPAPGNIPGGRAGSSTWIDSNGNLWLWGGSGYDSKANDITLNSGSTIALNDLWEYTPSSNAWTWMGGSSAAKCGANGCVVTGVYGSLGVPNASNQPGGRGGQNTWTDLNGNVWVFGGWGSDANGSCCELNDMWEFNPSSKLWTWMGGGTTVTWWGGNTGIYGKLGTPEPSNVPGSRAASTTWTDRNGKLWLFGGIGTDSNGNWGTLNELWVFDPAKNEWAWMGGSNTIPAWSGLPGAYATKGTPAAGNWPGSRSRPMFWTDSSGNFWLFGGSGYDAKGNTGNLNDLWEFNPSTGLWTWVSGSSTLNCVSTVCSVAGSYGTLETPATGNVPGGRQDGSAWTDSQGNLWLFGGYGADASGNSGDLNDLWKFNTLTRTWTWMGGSEALINGESAGTYGKLGIPAAGNIPSGRYMSATWTDSSGNYWLFGGEMTMNSNPPQLNDLWMYQPASALSLPATTTTLASSQVSSVYGQQVTFTATVSSGSGTPPDGETVWFMSGTTLLGTGTLSGGTTTLETTALPAGKDSVTALYQGDASLGASNSAPLAETVAMASTTVTLTSSPNPSSYQGPVTFTAVVTGQFGGTPTGTVNFDSGSTVLGSAPLSNGKALFTFAQLPSARTRSPPSIAATRTSAAAAQAPQPIGQRSRLARICL